MAAATARALIEAGSAEDLGARVVDGGINFAVYSPAAARVELCLFDAAGRETARFDLPAQSDGIWHGFFPRLEAGQQYGFRAHGPYDPEAGARFNPNKLLLDPYARALAGRVAWSDAVFDYERLAGTEQLTPSTRDSADFVPKCIAMARRSSPVKRHAVPWGETLIYELNVRGYTMRHPGVGEADRGRFSALAGPAVLRHLKALGVTSIELMPIHAFVDEEFLVGKRLRNFWGYNSLAFFAPEPRYLGADGVTGLERVIDALHAAGFEVIIDVVYNHTAEGGRLGPSLSFRGLANDTYYRLAADDPGEYINDTGCGNSVNTNDPMVRRLIVDSLSYWVLEMGVDGFRFDLASTLGRTSSGFDREHVLFRDIEREPALRGIKLIAEPWDVGPGGYQLGAFPAGWAEWNDRFRDTVRRFWRQDASMTPELARRIHGSADIFEPSGRGPAASVNFVASHDGFTTADLVSYCRRHNAANGESGRDGHEHNFSCNHGVEGPTEDPTILAARRRHRLNLLATLLLAQGTPMLLAGDEFGNSQSGNNNAYAQDNATAWLDWTALEADPGFFAEIESLVRLRRELVLLRQTTYRHGAPAALTGRADVEWLNADGAPIADKDWSTTRTLGVLLSDPGRDGEVSGRSRAVCILYNELDRDVDFALPGIAVAGAWICRFSSAGDSPSRPGRVFRLAGFSIACLSFETASLE
jgi:isoamylase